MSVWLFLVHWLHVLGGVVWLGGMVITYFVFWPSLLRRPPAEARAIVKEIERPMRATMGAAAQLVFWLGIIRGTWLGPIDSFSDMMGTAYGHTFLGAIGFTIGLAVHGAVGSRRFEERVWDGDKVRPGATAYVRRNALISFFLISAIVGLMVRMRFGL